MQLIQREFFYETGQIKESFFIDETERIQGEFLAWHDNGKLAKQSFYMNSFLNGEHKVWGDNGTLMCHCFYKDDKLDGEFKTWYKHGQLRSHHFFKDGEEILIFDLVEDHNNISKEEELLLNIKYGYFPLIRQ